MTAEDLMSRLHVSNKRQGPGSDKITALALDIACLDGNKAMKMADIGCGTGSSALMLAERFAGELTAVDIFPGCLEKLEKREFLKPGGILGVSEIVWTTPSRPSETEEYWTSVNDHYEKNVYFASAPAVLVMRDSTSAPKLVMRVFDLPTGRIEDLFAILDLNEDCVFHEVESGRRRVSRYVLEPSEKCAAEEAVPSTCGGWGVGNSGMRYFEVHKAVPDKAVFVEIGQEQPLFDPESIRFARP